MTPPNNQSQEVLREFTGYELCTKWCGRSYQWESLLDIERIRWNNLAAQLNTRTTHQEPLNHCSTCKHFKRIYPENKQLGICEYLEVTNLQPCGHMIDRPLIASDKFVAARGHNICVNRMMDNFGCVYHYPKEEGRKSLEQQVEMLQKKVETLRECNAQLVASEQSIRNETNRLRQEKSKLETRLKEVEGAAKKMFEMMKAMDDDLKENMPEYERIEGVNETFELAKSAGIGKE